MSCGASLHILERSGTIPYKIPDQIGYDQNVWRVIPGFDGYIANKDGEVKRLYSGKLKQVVVFNQKKKVFSKGYTLINSVGTKKRVYLRDLLRKTWPELEEQGIIRFNKKDFKQSKALHRYWVSKDGDVLNPRYGMRIMKPYIINNDEVIRFNDDCLRYEVRVEDLVKEVWGNQTEEDMYDSIKRTPLEETTVLKQDEDDGYITYAEAMEHFRSIRLI